MSTGQNIEQAIRDLQTVRCYSNRVDVRDYDDSLAFAIRSLRSLEEVRRQIIYNMSLYSSNSTAGTYTHEGLAIALSIIDSFL